MEDNMNVSQTPGAAETGNQAQPGTTYGNQAQPGATYGNQAQPGATYGQPGQPGMYYGQQPGQPGPYSQPPQGGMYYGQPGFSPVPPAQPPVKKKKGAAGLIIALVILGILLIGVAVWLLVGLLGDTPQAKISKGFQNWAKETEDYGSSIGEQLGWEQIRKMINEESVAIHMSMDLTVPDAGIPTVGVDINSGIDREKKLQNSDIAVSVSNMQLIRFQMAADADRIYLACPELAEKTYSFGTKDLGKKFNGSAWAALTGWTLDESLDFDLWAEADPAETEAGEAQTAEDLFGKEALERMTGDMQQIAQTMIVEATDASIEIERNGKKVSCDGYRVVLEKEAMNAFLDDLQEEIRSGKYGQMVKERMMESLDVPGEVDEIWEEAVSILDGRLTEDLELVFYLDNRNRIVHMATPEPVRLDTSDIGFAFAVDFNGAERTLDDVSGTVKFIGALPEDSLSIDFTRTAECGKDTYKNWFEAVLSAYDAYSGEEESLSVVYSNQWNLKTHDFDIDLTVYVEDEELSLNLEGAFENIRKGEAFTLNIGSASLRLDDDTLLKLRGTYEVGPLQGQIEVPENATDLLAMSENEITLLVYEMAMNLEDAFDLGSEFLQ